MRGDLQEGHVYGKRLCGYASRMPIPSLSGANPSLPEHKIGIFVLGVAPAALSQMTLVQFYRWGDAAAEALNRWDDSRWAKAAADVGALGNFGHKKEGDLAVTLSEISERYCNPFYSSYSSLLRRSC